MSPLLTKSRIVAAIRGAFIGDAASLGTHWVYDPKEMASIVPSVDVPEFKDPPTPKYYSSSEFPGHYDRAGLMSPYGEQMLFVAEYLAENTDNVSGPDMTTKMLAWMDSYTGRPDSAMKQMQTNAKEGKEYPDIGADDNQAHCFIKALFVACLYAGKPELLSKVQEVVRVHQQNEQAVAFGVAAAVLTEAVLMGATLPEAIEKSRDAIASMSLEKTDDVLQALARAKSASESDTERDDVEALMLAISHDAMVGKEDSPFYDLAGRSCALPGSFLVPVYFFHKNSENPDEEAFISSLRANILAAGDTCSRAAFVGGILGAVHGDVPQSWLDKMDNETMSRIDAAADKIADFALATCENK